MPESDNKVIGWVVAAVVVCLVGVVVVPRQLRWKDLRGRTVRLRGSIRDTQGQPLNGVQCRIAIGSAYDDRRHEPPPEKAIVNGRYDIKRRDVTDVGMSFAKEGYYPDGYVYNLANVDPQTSSIKGVQTIERNVVLEPVLKGLPDLYGTVSFLGLWGDDADSILVMYMGRLSAGELGASYDHRQIEITTVTKAIEYPYTSNSLRLGYPYLAADLLPQPGVMRACEDQSKWQKPPFPVSPKDAIAQLRLCEAGTSDGLILTPPEWVSDPSDEKRRLFPREMQEAPADGYKPVVSIPAEAFLDDGVIRVFFFLRCESLYGKGWIDDIRYYEKTGNWDCKLHLRINTTGSRNIATHPKELE